MYIPCIKLKKRTHSNEDTQNNIVVSRTPSSTTTQQPDSYPTDQKQSAIKGASNLTNKDDKSKESAKED